MANILYRLSTPTVANASNGGVNRPLSNEEIDKNFFALNNSKLESESDTLSSVTARGASTSTNLSMTGSNTLGASGITTTINGILRTSSIKGPSNISLDIYGGDINSETGFVTTISGGNRTGPSSFADGGGPLYLKGGDCQSGNGYNTGGDIYVYGGDITGYSLPGSAEGSGGDVHIVSGTNSNTTSVAKSSGNINIDVAELGANGTRTYGTINIGTASAYKATGGIYESTTINIGTTTGLLNVHAPSIFKSYVYINSSSRIEFRDENQAPGSVSTWVLDYVSGDFSISKYPLGGGTLSTPFKFGNDNTFYVNSGNIYASGEVRAGGDVISYYTSDESLKTNIVKIDSALFKVNQLDGITFNWNEKANQLYSKNTQVREAGVVAQQVQKVLPEVVSERENGTLAVKYEQLVPLLIEAVKELSAKVENLQNQLDNK